MAETSKKGGKRGKKQQHVCAAAIAMDRQETNPAIRISDADSNTPDIITSNEEVPSCEGEAEPNMSKRPPRGKAKGDKDFKKYGRIELEFNVRGQHVGRFAGGFSSFLGVTTRSFVPLTLEDWSELTDEYKDQIWKHITQHYVVPECFRKVIFRRMIKIWKDSISVKMKEVMAYAEEVGLPRPATELKPDLDSIEDWQAFVKSRTTAEFKEKSERFKKLRGQKTLLHRTSKKSFACLEHELKQQSEKPDTVTRGVVWTKAYEAKPKKGSNEEVEDPEIVKQVKKYLEEEQTAPGPSSIKNDAIAKVLGPDPRGRVRGFGFGALPSKVDAQSHMANKMTVLEADLATQKQTVANLQDVVKSLCAQLRLNGYNFEQTGAQHSGTEIGQEKFKENPSVKNTSNEVQQSKRKIATIEGACNEIEENNPRKQLSRQVSGNKQFSGQDRSKQVQKTHSVSPRKQLSRQVSGNKQFSGQDRSKKVQKTHSVSGKKQYSGPENSKQVHKTNMGNKVHLLSWFAKEEVVVATASIISKDPQAEVHHVPLGHDCWKVTVHEVFQDIALYRSTSEFTTLYGSTGSMIAWPIKYIKED